MKTLAFLISPGELPRGLLFYLETLAVGTMSATKPYHCRGLSHMMCRCISRDLKVAEIDVDPFRH